MDSRHSFRESPQQPRDLTNHSTSNKTKIKQSKNSYYEREMFLLGTWLIALLVAVLVL